MLYRGTKTVVLSIDGLQPEKDHETLYVVREVTENRVWFAEPLLSGATDEVQKLFVRAKEMAQRLGVTVALWISDKQDAFLKSVVEVFPDTPHRFCENHFFRDLAKHERRIHGHHHAGVRIVREGPTLIPTLDAHSQHPGVFSREDLIEYSSVKAPSSQLDSQHRH